MNINNLLPPTFSKRMLVVTNHPNSEDPRVIDSQLLSREFEQRDRLKIPEILSTSLVIFDQTKQTQYKTLQTHMMRLDTFMVKALLNSSFKLQFIATVAKNVLTALDHIHKSGLVHCEIRPYSIVLTKNGIRIGQLLSVMSAGEPFIGFQNEGQSKDYQAPQVQFDEYKANPKMDIWALGVLLYDLALWQTPKSRPINFELLDPEYQSFIKKCMTKRSAVRPEASELLLDEFIRNADSNKYNEIIKIIQKNNPRNSEIGKSSFFSSDCQPKYKQSEFSTKSDILSKYSYKIQKYTEQKQKQLVQMPPEQNKQLTQKVETPYYSYKTQNINKPYFQRPKNIEKFASSNFKKVYHGQNQLSVDSSAEPFALRQSAEVSQSSNGLNGSINQRIGVGFKGIAISLDCDSLIPSDNYTQSLPSTRSPAFQRQNLKYAQKGFNIATAPYYLDDSFVQGSSIVESELEPVRDRFKPVYPSLMTSSIISNTQISNDSIASNITIQDMDRPEKNRLRNLGEKMPDLQKAKGFIHQESIFSVSISESSIAPISTLISKQYHYPERLVSNQADVVIAFPADSKSEQVRPLLRLKKANQRSVLNEADNLKKLKSLQEARMKIRNLNLLDQK